MTRFPSPSSRPVSSSNIEPHRVAKLSGIGCSSKTPDYLLGQSHGFNSVHGRMPSVLTGANLANKDLIYLGVSGDGDSASIGLGQFVHCVRRGVNMVYITENNGVYGLTKGQFSATADKGSKSKAGGSNMDSPLDLVSMALMVGATFVGRSFSGDKEQMVPLIMAAMSHPGPAFIDIVSPCVAFNNHAGSTKAYDFVRAHNEAVNRLDIMEPREAITVEYAPGTTEEVALHDGSTPAAGQAGGRLRSLRPHRGDDLSAEPRRGGRTGHRPDLYGPRRQRHARQSQHGGRAAEPAVGKRTVPRRSGLEGFNASHR